mgnify:CR=1 FL=1
MRATDALDPFIGEQVAAAAHIQRCALLELDVLAVERDALFGRRADRFVNLPYVIEVIAAGQVGAAEGDDLLLSGDRNQATFAQHDIVRRQRHAAERRLDRATRLARVQTFQLDRGGLEPDIAACAQHRRRRAVARDLDELPRRGNGIRAERAGIDLARLHHYFAGGDQAAFGP